MAFRMFGSCREKWLCSSEKSTDIGGPSPAPEIEPYTSEASFVFACTREKAEERAEPRRPPGSDRILRPFSFRAFCNSDMAAEKICKGVVETKMHLSTSRSCGRRLSQSLGAFVRWKM